MNAEEPPGRYSHTIILLCYHTIILLLLSRRPGEKNQREAPERDHARGQEVQTGRLYGASSVWTLIKTHSIDSDCFGSGLCYDGMLKLCFVMGGG